MDKHQTPISVLYFSNFSRDNTTVECQNGYWFDPASGYKSTLVTDVSNKIKSVRIVYMTVIAVNIK